MDPPHGLVNQRSFARTHALTHARTKRNDFPVGRPRRIHPPNLRPRIFHHLTHRHACEGSCEGRPRIPPGERAAHASHCTGRHAHTFKGALPNHTFQRATAHCTRGALPTHSTGQRAHCPHIPASNGALPTHSTSQLQGAHCPHIHHFNAARPTSKGAPPTHRHCKGRTAHTSTTHPPLQCRTTNTSKGAPPTLRHCKGRTAHTSTTPMPHAHTWPLQWAHAHT